MVVINTKKIFITILVSALLLVGSALTVFASDFEFSAPNNSSMSYSSSIIYFGNVSNFDFSNSDGSVNIVFNFVGTLNEFHLYFTEYGINFLANGDFDINNIISNFDNFIGYRYGTYFDIVTTGYISDVSSFVTYLSDYNVSFSSLYNSNPTSFDVVGDLNKQFFNYETQYNQLLTQYNALQLIYNDLVDDVQELSIQYETLLSSNRELESQYNQLLTQYNALQTSYNDLNNTFVSMRDYYKDEISILQNNLSYAQNLADELSAQVFDLQQEIKRLKDVVAQEYMKGYTQAFEDYDLFEDGLYSIFSAPFTIVYELAEIEVFGFSIVRIVGIILLFVVLSFILAFIWKVIPLL